MNYTELTPKELKDQELVTLHRTLLIDFMKNHTKFKLRKRKQILRLYDEEINRDNIRQYYNRHIKIFLWGIMTGRLPEIIKYKKMA